MNPDGGTFVRLALDLQSVWLSVGELNPLVDVAQPDPRAAAGLGAAGPPSSRRSRSTCS